MKYQKIMKYFSYDHLPIYLQEVSRPFYELATEVYRSHPNNEEAHECLRKLLEAKDCAVRACL